MNSPGCFSLLFLWLAATGSVPNLPAEELLARGFVYHDLNGNRQLDPTEEGIEGVGVSNGREIVRTDAQGRYELPIGNDAIIFVIKPSGWMTPLNDRLLPQFYYIHKPEGSPTLQYSGIKPTGPLPEWINFPLSRSDEPRRFEAIMFGDTQPRDRREIGYIAHDVVEELIGTDAAFGVTLGDIVFDNLEDFDLLNQTIALIGIPWYNVIGNHDINYDSPDDRYSDETYENVYGPSYYSFNYGAAHFIVVDDVEWIGATESEEGYYRGGLGEAQLEFIRHDLSLVPEDQLVVLLMHIPLLGEWDDPQRQALYRLIEERPFCFSISAHTHWQAHWFMTEQEGWRGPQPHHHLINVTVSGSWWSGEPDERGIPHTMMRCGAPNGYTIITFDGSSYSMRYKPAGFPADYQINIHAPEEIKTSEAAGAEVLVNVFAGSERSHVEMRVGANQPWSSLEKVIRPDPFYADLKRREADQPPKAPYRELPKETESYHLWAGKLPSDLGPGLHLIEVRTTDMFDQTYTAQRSIRLAP
jgi:hypothetical protein